MRLHANQGGKTMLGGNFLGRAGASFVALIAVFVLFAASAAQAQQPIVIGASVSQTGPLAVDAAYHLRGLQLCVADANARSFATLTSTRAAMSRAPVTTRARAPAGR